MDPMTVSLLMEGLNEHSLEGTSIIITNLHEIIYYKPSKQVDLPIQVGDDIHKETITFKALQNKKRISEERDCKVSGVQYYGVAVPIFKDGIVQGAVTTIYPLKPSLLASPFLTVKSADRWLPIHFKDIIYLEAQNRKTNVHTTIENCTHRYNLSELETSLPTDTFIRCHRSYIININHIEEILPDSNSTFLLVMTGKNKIPVSQSYSSYFRKLLNF